MIRHDYIMRMIEQFAGFVAEVMSKMKSGLVEEARSDIQSASLRLLGFEYDLLLRLSNEDVLRSLGLGEPRDAPKCYVASRLLHADAQSYDQQGDSSEAARRYVKSLDLLLTCFPHLKDDMRNEAAETIDATLAALDNAGLPPAVAKRLIAFHEHMGRYSEAEDCLFELAESGENDVRELGESFYERLKEKPDEELSNGNLPREELEEGLSEFRAKFGT